MTDTEQNDIEKARQFWREAREKAQAGDCEFSGQTFPEDPDKQGFREITFKGQANFSSVTFEGVANFTKAIFEGNADFEQATFKVTAGFSRTRFQSEANFKNTTFSAGDANFEQTTFEGNTFFANAVFNKNAPYKGSSFTRAAFNGTKFHRYAGFEKTTWKQAVHFQDSTFCQNASFQEARFEAPVFFEDATFQAKANFQSSRFEFKAIFTRGTFDGTADFNKEVFKGEAAFSNRPFTYKANFSGATFEGKVCFSGATFKGEALFQRTTFGGRCDFLRVKFEEVGFGGATFKSKACFALAEVNKGIWLDMPSQYLRKWKLMFKPFEIVSEGEKVYRLAKQITQQNGNYREAGQFHYAEQCAINARQLSETCYCPCKPRFWNRKTNPLWTWGEFFIGRLLFGYGEKPIRVFSIGIVFILALAAIYCLTGDVVSNGQEACFHNPVTSLYFSVVTFTTLGYGDLNPAGWVRLLAGAEALLGAAMMALFIVSLARKFTR